ncbi:dihydrodipicolinate synthase family protein [Aquihabitans sp. McL0605]|uniref:dihydrodipicolinate synthase family protein n=1 Tax=Aquihabitans sp. McL0605 TaxID=3415671 RepID=UPI003CF05A58
MLLPFLADGEPDWDGFAHLLGQVVDAGLTPLLNAGPGAGDLLDASTRAEVIATVGAALGGRSFVAGVRAEDGADGGFDPSRLAGSVAAISRHGGTPALLPSPTLSTLDPDEAIGLLAWMGEWCSRLIAVDLPAERWPGGRAWGMDAFTALLEQDTCVGLVDGSWNRQVEWDRIRRRDDLRPDFALYSANALGIDQIMYGADHALDLAAAVPDAIADRDEAWAREDPDVIDRNDALQALATFIFRPPFGAARHALARTLFLRGWLAHDGVHHALPRRPESDDDLLLPALDRLGLL